MSRKLLLIAPQPFFSTRGTPMNVRALAESLSRNGSEVHLLVYPFGEPVTIPGVSIHRCPGVPGIRTVPVGASIRKLLLDLPFSIKALILSIRHRYDAFHGVEEGGFVAGTLGLLFHRPYIYDMDSCMIDQLQSGKFRRLSWMIGLVDRMERFYLRRAKAILTVAAPLTKKAESIAPNVPIYQIEDFPLDSADQVDPELCEQLRASYTKGAKQIVLYTGNLEYYQGVELALLAWKSFQAINPASNRDTRLLLVGGTRQQIRSLEALSRELAIEESVTFTGPRAPEEMGSFLALADAVISPRIVGGNTPLKIFTYMASGKPIIATRISAHTAVLDDRTAFLASPEPESLAKAIQEALVHENRAHRAKAALDLVKSRYSREHFETRLTALYESVFPSPVPPPQAEAEMSPL